MKRFLLIILTIALFINACKKENKQEEGIEKFPACATIIENIADVNFRRFYTIKFDNQGKITEQNYFTDPNRLISTIKYEYYSDKVLAYYKRNGSSTNVITTHLLDSKGRIIKIIDSNRTRDYEYNDEGYLIKSTSKISETTFVQSFTWESGNLTKVATAYNVIGYPPSETTDNINYEDDIFDDKLVADYILKDIYSSEYLLDFFGKKPKNTPVDYLGKIYSYIRDSNGRIIGFEKDDKREALVYTYNLDYNCN